MNIAEDQRQRSLYRLLVAPLIPGISYALKR